LILVELLRIAAAGERLGKGLSIPAVLERCLDPIAQRLVEVALRRVSLIVVPLGLADARDSSGPGGGDKIHECREAYRGHGYSPVSECQATLRASHCPLQGPRRATSAL